MKIIELNELISVEKMNFRKKKHQDFLRILEQDKLVGGEDGYLKSLLFEIKDEIKENIYDICGTSYIVYSNSLAVGYLYISNPYGIDAYVTVSYTILEKYRGLGYAKALLSMIDILLSSDVATIKLVIDNSNVASKNLAVCSGYVENTDINTKSNYKVYQKRKIS